MRKQDQQEIRVHHDENQITFQPRLDTANRVTPEKLQSIRERSKSAQNYRQMQARQRINEREQEQFFKLHPEKFLTQPSH